MMKMNATCAVGGLVAMLLMGRSVAAGPPDGFKLKMDRDGVQFGASLDPRQHGYEHAYRDGADRGRFDRTHGVRYNLKAKGYNDTSRGYEAFMGDKRLYQKGYSEGYLAGYDNGYRGGTSQYHEIYGRTADQRTQWQHQTDPYASRRWSAKDVAFDIGYRDGVTAGQYDRERKSRPDFENDDAYRKANHGYDKEYGESTAYQGQYRIGFERGYEDGYGRSR